MNKTILKNYAKLIVRIGANVQKGQDVTVACSVDDAYFAKYVVEEAYKAGARKVDVEWACDEIEKIVMKKTKLTDLQEFPNWKVEKMLYRKEKLPCFIYIDSEDPDSMNGLDQEKMAKVRQAHGKIIRPIRKEMENKYQWVIAAIPGKKWAKKLFPELSTTKAMEALWENILSCSRAYGDPIENWNKHNEELNQKTKILNDLKIKKLTYKNELGTDFTVSLFSQLQFIAGGAKTISGTDYLPNIPTEECFTSPNPTTAEGVVYASKPLSYNGKVLVDFGFRFHEGVVVEVLAKDDDTKNALEQMISLDEGAKKLGEVALVPFDSPINQTGLLFYNTLYDENACCHLALGMGFEENIIGYETMSREEIESIGINDSMLHTDFMIGTNDLSIVAETEDGKTVKIFDQGTWAI